MTKMILGYEIIKMPLKKMHANEAFNFTQLDQDYVIVQCGNDSERGPS